MTEKKPEAVEEDLFDTESTGGELFKFETVGQKVTGLIVNRKSGKTRLGEGVFWTILTQKGEVTFIPTKALGEDLDKFNRQYGGLGKVVVDIEFVEEKKGAYASPFKVFKVRAGGATEARLSALGIATFDTESKNSEEEIPL